jgi:hypothetical protein
VTLCRSAHICRLRILKYCSSLNNIPCFCVEYRGANFSAANYDAVYPLRGPGSSFGVATPLRVGRSEDRIQVGARFSAPVQTGPGSHPTSCTMGNGSFPAVKSGRGVTLNSHFLLVPWSRKSRPTPLLTLRAVQPVQSLSIAIPLLPYGPYSLYRASV